MASRIPIMKFKHRIWLLPIMTAVIVTVGIAVTSRITSMTSAALTLRAAGTSYHDANIQLTHLSQVGLSYTYQGAILDY